MAEEKIIKIEGATIEGKMPAGSIVTDTGGGVAVQGGVETGGGKMTGRDDVRYSPNATTGSITFGNQDNAILWNAIVMLGDRLNERINTIDVKLDDLPARVGKLEVRVPPITVPVALAFPPTFWAVMVVIGLVLLAVAFFVGRGF